LGEYFSETIIYLDLGTIITTLRQEYLYNAFLILLLHLIFFIAVWYIRNFVVVEEMYRKCLDY